MMDVLCCKITIGDANPSNPMEIKDAIEITEVQSIEINETYRTFRDGKDNPPERFCMSLGNHRYGNR